MSPRPRIEFHRPAALGDPLLDSVVEFMQASVEAERSWIVQRLRRCHELILYRDRDTGRVCGTTALDVVDLEHEGASVRALYTGAVVLGAEVRGQSLTQRAGALSYLRHGLLWRGPVYWFSECDSFRAYLLAVRNFEAAWPRRGAEMPSFDRAVYERLCGRLFGPDYDPVRGVCAPIAGRRLRRELAEIPSALHATDPDAAYFAERAPSYLEGEALPVLARLDARNWLSLARHAATKAVRGLSDRRSAGRAPPRPIRGGP